MQRPVTQVKQENTPANAVPYRKVNKPFRFLFVVPGKGIIIEEDANGVCYISTEGGLSVSDLVAGDNIELTYTEDGKIVVSAVNTVADIAAGQNVTITVDEETGTAIINAITGGETNEHYQGVFDTPEDLIEFDSDPEQGDYGLIKNLVISDGGEHSWNGQYKYCFYINGAWTVVDQMLTFTKDTDLLQQFYSVGGSSPVIYLHEIAKTGNFWDLNNVPIVATPVVTVEGTTVTAECATEGAEIWYTTDGTMPHVNGNKYTGPITATGATTYRFVGIKNGMINSLEAVASADYELQPPTIELDWHDGTITMTNPNVDGNDEPVGVIMYSIYGGSPTSTYSEPIDVSNLSIADVKAIVFDSDNSKESPVSSAVFTRIKPLELNQNLNTNLITGIRNLFVNSKDETGGLVVRYEWPPVDTVTWASTEMEEPLSFNVFEKQSIRYKAFAPGRIPMPSHWIFGSTKPGSPAISFDVETNKVSIANMTGIPQRYYPDPSDLTGCRIYYTIDGSVPTDQSPLYTGPFLVSGNVTVKAVLIAYGQYSSDIVTLEITMLDAPTFSLNSNTGALTMTNHNGSGTVYYTLDGSTPTSESNPYSAPVVLTATKTVKAIVISGSGSSPVAEQTFTKAAAPKINNGNVQILNNLNTLTGKYTVTMQTQQQGGTTRFTSDDGGQVPSDPTYQSPAYAEAISVGFYEAVTFRARTFAEGYIPSSVTSQSFGITEVNTPEISYDDERGTVTFERQWITVNIPLQTNNNTPELGCRIWYTTDGTTPSVQNGTLWDGNPVAVQPGDTVKAVLVCYGEYSSSVASYTVPGGETAYGVRHYLMSGSVDPDEPKKGSVLTRGEGAEEETTDPESPELERVGSAELHRSLPVQSLVRRCVVDDDGDVVYYLDAHNSLLKADGTAADLSGADGQYMVEIPAHYRKYVKEDEYEEFWLSLASVEGFEFVPRMLVSADEACIDRDTNTLCAVVNNAARYRGGNNDDTLDNNQYLTLLGRPASNISWENFYAFASKRGDGWTNYMTYVNTTIYWLFMVEYATLNSQKAFNAQLTEDGFRQGGLGTGTTDFQAWFDANGGEPFLPTGVSAILGNSTGIVEYSIEYGDPAETYTAHVSTYRGITEPFGHLGKAASGCLNTSDGDIVFCNDPTKVSFTPTQDYTGAVAASVDGYVSGIGYVNGNLYPIAGIGTDDTYFCDYGFIGYHGSVDPDPGGGGNDRSSGGGGGGVSVYVPFLGGDAGAGSGCGLACFGCGRDPARARPSIGSRLCFIDGEYDSGGNDNSNEVEESMSK